MWSQYWVTQPIFVHDHLFPVCIILLKKTLMHQIYDAKYENGRPKKYILCLNSNGPDYIFLSSKICCLFCLPNKNSIKATSILNLFLLTKFYYFDKMLKNCGSCSE